MGKRLKPDNDERIVLAIMDLQTCLQILLQGNGEGAVNMLQRSIEEIRPLALPLVEKFMKDRGKIITLKNTN